MTVAIAPDPVKQAAGKLGAEKRWAGHERRIVRLSELLPEEAAIVRSLLALKRARESASTTEAA